jgi:hypothetical protein
MRREQHDLLADVLQTALESVGEAATEVGEAHRELSSAALQIDDDGTTGPQPIGDLPSVIEVMGRNDQDLKAWRAHEGEGPCGPLSRRPPLREGLLAATLIVAGTDAALGLSRGCEASLARVVVNVAKCAVELADQSA